MRWLPSGSAKIAMWHTPVSRVSPKKVTPLDQLRARRLDVLDAHWQRIAGLGDELHPDPHGLPDDEAGVARPLLVLRVLIGAHAEDVAVEAARAPGVLRGDADEVELFDECHARQSVSQLRSGSRKAARAMSTRDRFLPYRCGSYRYCACDRFERG
jgi:hypothetical protein